MSNLTSNYSVPIRNQKTNKKPNQSWFMISTVWKEFCDSTSMHALKFMANDEATVLERFNFNCFSKYG